MNLCFLSKLLLEGVLGFPLYDKIYQGVLIHCKIKTKNGILSEEVLYFEKKISFFDSNSEKTQI